MHGSATWDGLREACASIAAGTPELSAALHETVLDASPSQGLARLLGRVLHPAWMSAAALVELAEGEFTWQPGLAAAALDDLAVTSGRNLEPGDSGAAWTWLGHRGFHILAAHRLVHGLWSSSRQPLALAVKAGAAPLGADIHPAARIGRRVFLDHGVGLVVGETAVIEDDVSVWHGVTLGGTLMEGGDRHPKIRRGAVIGAGATVLGNIEIGEGAVIAAGSVVTRAVPPFTLVAGNPAAAKPRYRHPFGHAPQGAEEVL